MISNVPWARTGLNVEWTNAAGTEQSERDAMSLLNAQERTLEVKHSDEITWVYRQLYRLQKLRSLLTRSLLKAELRLRKFDAFKAEQITFQRKNLWPHFRQPWETTATGCLLKWGSITPGLQLEGEVQISTAELTSRMRPSTSKDGGHRWKNNKLLCESTGSVCIKMSLLIFQSAWNRVWKIDFIGANHRQPAKNSDARWWQSAHVSGFGRWVPK